MARVLEPGGSLVYVEFHPLVWSVGETFGLDRDDYFTRDFTNNIGAEIMGRGKFGPQQGPWEDLEWQGWWGDEPPYHCVEGFRQGMTASDISGAAHV